jgi:hypothetical protein
MTHISLVRFQTEHSLLPNNRSMDSASRQVESVSYFEGELLFEFGEAECDRAAYYVDNLIVGM